MAKRSRAEQSVLKCVSSPHLNPFFDLWQTCIDISPIRLLNTFSLKTRFGLLEVPTSVTIRSHDMVDVCGSTMDMNVVTANRSNQISSSPHTNTPAITRIGGRTDTIFPVPSLLSSYVPKTLTIFIP